ncbi:hypothetical protein JNM87_02940 [Candidatus Saccharibacteria bacterium]|nr:hypothetical protein [Candidatus Saccharibacteria bacterium]
MADDNSAKKQTDNEQASAEKHVTELMGPAQGFNEEYTVPKKADTKAEPQPADKPEVKPAEVVKDNPLPSAPPVPENTTKAADPRPGLNAAASESDSVAPEKDLNMDELPSEFTTPGIEDDEKTAAAVEDILHHDADKTLEDDVPVAHATVMKPSFMERLKNGWFEWWDNPRKRYGTLILLAVLIAVVGFVPAVRAFVLNTAGVRASMVVHVTDNGTNLPLENVVVKTDGKTGKTDFDGKLQIKGVHLGTQKVQIEKIGFKSVSRQVKFGLNIADLGEIKLIPTGQQLTYTFTDYLSGKPVAGVAVSSGESTTKSDKNGKALLTTAPGSTEKITVKSEGYRTETLDHPKPESPALAVKLVPSAQAIFISKESGTYDVYKQYVDGKNRKLLFEGTGLETQAISALPSPDGKKVAVASTRDDKRNKDGYLLTALNVVDTETGDSTNIEYAEQVMLLGWRKDTLVYLQTVAGASAANPNRQKIISYDLTTNKRFQLASANYFAGEELIGDTLYYTVSATDPSAQETFTKVNVDGTAKKSLYTGNVWSLLRSDYSKLKLQAPDKWLEYTVGASAPVDTTPVSDYVSRYYLDNPDGKVSARVDVRDSKGYLMIRNLSDGKETELTSQRNMQAPTYWLNNDVLIFRVSGAAEVADYAINFHGGAAKKIADVSLTGIH